MPLQPPARILVVDDDDAVRTVVCQMLSGPEFDITEASRGRMAVDMVAADPYDIVLLDVGMPDMSGVVACERMRQSNPGQRVIFMTGDAERSELDAAAPNTWVLPKPFRLAALLDAVKAAL